MRHPPVSLVRLGVILAPLGILILSRQGIGSGCAEITTGTRDCAPVAPFGAYGGPLTEAQAAPPLPPVPPLGPDGYLAGTFDFAAGLGGSAGSPDGSFTGLVGPPGSVFPPFGDIYPPDPTIAVGPSHVVETVNSSIGIFDKAGGMIISSVPLGFGGLFGPVGAGPMTFVFDPRCLYDQYMGRFVAIGLSVTITAGIPTSSTIYIGVSDDSIPMGLWYVYATPALTPVPTPGGVAPAYVDYPGLGVDGLAVYVTANLYAGGVFGNLYRIFPKTGMLPMSGLYFGGPIAPPPGVPPPPGTYRTGVELLPLAGPAFDAVKPAHHFGANPAAYFVSAMRTRTTASGTFSTIRVQAIAAPLAPIPVITSAFVIVPAYTTPTFGLGATQPGVPPSHDLRVHLGELMNAVWRGGHLWTAHATLLAGKTAATWYEFATGGFPMPPGIPTLIQAGMIDAGPGVYTFYPAILANAAFDVKVVFALSSPMTLPGVYFTGRSAADPLGIMPLPITPLALGISSYYPVPPPPPPPPPPPGWQVWGDYFGIAVDPLDDTTIWGVGEVALDTTTWGTAFGVLDACGVFTAYGTGLAGSGGIVPVLAGVGTPVGGAAVSIGLTSGLGGATSILGFSLSSASIPLLGGTLLVDPASLILMFFPLSGPAGVPGAGATSFPLTLPFLPGLEIFVQGGVLDAGAPMGVAFSNGLEMCIG